MVSTPTSTHQRRACSNRSSPKPTVRAIVINAGVFIPLVEFERRGIDTAVAVKALCDTRMLATDPLNPHAKTASRTVNDERILGVVLAPQFVTGLDASRLAPAAPPQARR